MSMDTVFIERLTVETVIGIYDWERAARQPVVLSVSLVRDAGTAADDIEGTVDYGAVVETLKTFVSARSDGLLETLADACVAMLHRQFPKARAIGLRIEKPNAAHKLGCERVGVETRREFG